MAPPDSRRSIDVLWSSDRNAVTKALVGVAVGYCDTLVDLLRRNINETAKCFGEECNTLSRCSIHFSLSMSYQSDKLKEPLMKY
jgi:hypothetical protein